MEGEVNMSTSFLNLLALIQTYLLRDKQTKTILKLNKLQ